MILRSEDEAGDERFHIIKAAEHTESKELVEALIELCITIDEAAVRIGMDLKNLASAIEKK